MTDPKQNTPAPPRDVKPPEQDPAAERGERIDTGKDIARGGKDHGAVEGAEEQST